MLSIIIKSFNRPHYLDRCLKSIELHVKGTYEIKVVDDGTPRKYLDKIQSQYPTIQIIPTAKYAEKAEQIENKSSVSKVIPSRDWYKVVEESSDYVLVIEDDVWFVGDLQADEILNQMNEKEMFLLKLGWNGMKLKEDNFEVIDENIQKRKINLFSLNPLIMDWMFSNKYKFYTILKKLKLIDSHEFYRYYLFISISSGIHKKEYWLKTWENLQESVNEKLQLKNAIQFYRKHKTQNFIGYFSKELIKTTFKSSATNSFHQYGFQFDVFEFNHILNDAWLNGEFDAMENYPKDFSDEYIQSFLEKANHPDAQYAEWKKWADKFKEQYRNLGAEIE